MMYKQIFIYITFLLFTSFLLAVFLLCLDFMSNLCLQECIFDLYNTLDQNYNDCLINERSFENEDKEFSRSPSLSYSEVNSCTSFIKNNRKKSNIFKQFKSEIEKQTRFIVHKIKVYNRTLS